MNLPVVPISLLLWLVFLLEAAPAPAIAGPQPPLSSLTAGHAMPVSLTVDDQSQLAEVRLYFKTMTADHYLFLPMQKTGGSTYQAELPPVKNWTKGIDYVLLRRSLKGEVRKSKPFRLLVMNDFASGTPATGEIPVQAEDPAAAAENHDFAVPRQVTVTADPLLAKAAEDPYPPSPIPKSENRSPGITHGLSGLSFFIRIGGVGFRYGSFFRR